MKYGDCYQRAFRALTEGWHDDLLAEENPLGELRFVLVHGFPRLTADSDGFPEGTKYGHAWLELVVRLADGSDCNMLVVDCGCHADSERTILPHFIYYTAGSIVEEECRRYEIDEAQRAALEHEHFGHWLTEDEAPEGVTYARED